MQVWIAGRKAQLNFLIWWQRTSVYVFALCSIHAEAHFQLPEQLYTYISYWVSDWLTDWLIIHHHSERSTRQCARIWSDNLYFPYTSRLEVIRDQTTSNFLVINLQLPHITPSSSWSPWSCWGHGCHVGHGGCGEHGGNGGQDRTGRDRRDNADIQTWLNG